MTSKMMCDVVCRRIKNAGYATRSAISVQEGIEIAIEETPSLILTDLMMPERDGVSLLKECSERFPGVPTIVMTGYPDDIMVREAMRYGPGAIITKPISRGQLIGNIETDPAQPSREREKIVLYGEFGVPAGELPASSWQGVGIVEQRFTHFFNAFTRSRHDDHIVFE